MTEGSSFLGEAALLAERTGDRRLVDKFQREARAKLGKWPVVDAATEFYCRKASPRKPDWDAVVATVAAELRDGRYVDLSLEYWHDGTVWAVEAVAAEGRARAASYWAEPVLRRAIPAETRRTALWRRYARDDEGLRQVLDDAAEEFARVVSGSGDWPPPPGASDEHPAGAVLADTPGSAFLRECAKVRQRFAELARELRERHCSGDGPVEVFEFGCKPRRQRRRTGDVVGLRLGMILISRRDVCRMPNLDIWHDGGRWTIAMEELSGWWDEDLYVEDGEPCADYAVHDFPARHAATDQDLYRELRLAADDMADYARRMSFAAPGPRRS